MMFRLVRNIRKRAELRNLPIVVISAAETADKAIAAGANEFMQKPFTPSQLVQTLQALVAQS